jgi:hypothetical protein
VTGLAVGALFSFTTLVIHSVGEFGLHIPAITLLAVVVCAQLSDLGLTLAAARQGQEAEPSNEYRLRLHGLAPCLGAAAGVALAWLLATHGWRAHQVAQLRAAANKARLSEEPDAQLRRRAYLQAAVALTPYDADLQLELASVWLKEIEQQSDQRLAKLFQLAAPSIVAWEGGNSAGWLDPALAALPLGAVLSVATPPPAEQRQTLAALRCYLRARDLCPILSEPHLGIGAHIHSFQTAEAHSAYLQRAQRLAPGEPKIWYKAGLQELAAGDTSAAWASWRRALELSDENLAPILIKASRWLSADELTTKVLPDQPDKLLKAATLPNDEIVESLRTVVLQRALGSLESQPDPSALSALRIKAKVYRALRQKAEAEAVYRSILDKGRGEAVDHYEYARFLYDDRRLGDALRQLRIGQALYPDHAPSRALAKIITHELTKVSE